MNASISRKRPMPKPRLLVTRRSLQAFGRCRLRLHHLRRGHDHARPAQGAVVGKDITQRDGLDRRAILGVRLDTSTRVILQPKGAAKMAASFPCQTGRRCRGLAALARLVTGRKSSVTRCGIDLQPACDFHMFSEPYRQCDKYCAKQNIFCHDAAVNLKADMFT